MDSTVKKQAHDRLLKLRMDMLLYRIEHKEESAELLEEFEKAKEEIKKEYILEKNNDMQKGEVKK